MAHVSLFACLTLDSPFEGGYKGTLTSDDVLIVPELLLNLQMQSPSFTLFRTASWDAALTFWSR